MHWAQIFLGANSTSKSFQLNVLSEWRVADTVVSYGQQSKESLNVDVPLNDEIVMAEEVNVKMVASDRYGGEGPIRDAFKDVLTSQVRERARSARSQAQVVRKALFAKGDTGRRETRVSYSQQIRTYFYGTNMLKSQLDQPIASRFLLVQCVVQRREERSPADLLGVKERLDWAGQRRVALAIEASRAEQFLHYHTDKLGVRALTRAPALTTHSHGGSADRRDIERLLGHCAAVPRLL